MRRGQCLPGASCGIALPSPPYQTVERPVIGRLRHVLWLNLPHPLVGDGAHNLQYAVMARPEKLRRFDGAGVGRARSRGGIPNLRRWLWLMEEIRFANRPSRRRRLGW